MAEDLSDNFTLIQPFDLEHKFVIGLRYHIVKAFTDGLPEGTSLPPDAADSIEAMGVNIANGVSLYVERMLNHYSDLGWAYSSTKTQSDIDGLLGR